MFYNQKLNIVLCYHYIESHSARFTLLGPGHIEFVVKVNHVSSAKKSLVFRPQMDRPQLSPVTPLPFWGLVSPSQSRELQPYERHYYI